MWEIGDCGYIPDLDELPDLAGYLEICFGPSYLLVCYDRSAYNGYRRQLQVLSWLFLGQLYVCLNIRKSFWEVVVVF